MAHIGYIQHNTTYTFHNDNNQELTCDLNQVRQLKDWAIYILNTQDSSEYNEEENDNK